MVDILLISCAEVPDRVYMGCYNKVYMGWYEILSYRGVGFRAIKQLNNIIPPPLSSNSPVHTAPAPPSNNTLHSAATHPFFSCQTRLVPLHGEGWTYRVNQCNHATYPRQLTHLKVEFVVCAVKRRCVCR